MRPTKPDRLPRRAKNLDDIWGHEENGNSVNHKLKSLFLEIGTMGSVGRDFYAPLPGSKQGGMHIMKNCFIKLFAACLGIMTTCLFAEQRVYTVGVELIPFMPYSDVVEKKYQGILRDILDGFAQEYGIKLKYEPLPISRLYAYFYSGKLDFKMPANKYWQKEIKEKRNLKIKYSSPLVHFLDGLMVKAGNENKKIEEISRIGVVSGFTPWEYLDRIKAKNLSTRENPSIVGLLEQGILGRVDAIYINVPVGQFYLRESLRNSSGLIFAKSLPHTKSHYHVATLRHDDLLQKLNKYLDRSKSKLADLRSRYKIDNY